MRELTIRFLKLHRFPILWMYIASAVPSLDTCYSTESHFFVKATTSKRREEDLCWSAYLA